MEEHAAGGTVKHTSHEYRRPLIFHWATRVIHWVSVLVLIALFASGLWMVSLDYYNPWYQSAPDWHRSVGLTLMIVSVLRVGLYRLPKPKPLASHAIWEHCLSVWLRVSMLVLLFTMFVSGYLITTATGASIDVFGFVNVPSIIQLEYLEEYAGEVHAWSAWALVALAGLHSLAALKHHFFDHDMTLRRMTFGSYLGGRTKSE